MKSDLTVDSRVWTRIAIILGVALLLRCWMLSRESLWIDEIASWAISSGSLQRALHAEPTNPPLYYVLLHFWIGLFGTSEAALRSLSIPPSLLSVWLVFRLADKLFSRTTAYLAATYQAISTFQIYYAQEARTFSFLVCFLLLATTALWNGLNATTRRRRFLWYAAYTLFGALSIYSHFIAFFFLAAHGLFVLLRRPRQVFWTAGSMFVALALFSPWLLTAVHAAESGGQIRRYLLLKLPQAYFSFLFGDTLIPLDEQAVLHVRQVLLDNWWILAGALASLAVLAPYGWRAWKRCGDRMSYVVNLSVVPVLLAWLVSFKVMLFDERYLIPASPFAYLVVTAAMTEFLAEAKAGTARGWNVRTGWAAVITYGLLLTLSLDHFYFDPRFGREEWREVAAYIESAGSPEQKDLIIVDPDYLQECYRYYQKRNFPIWPLLDRDTLAMRRSADIVRNHVRGFSVVWLVRSHYDTDDSLNALRSLYPVRSSREFLKGKGIEVYSFSVNQ